MKRSYPMLTWFLLTSVACQPEAPPDHRKDANDVPAFTAVTLDGVPASLAHYQGEVVLVNMWATWCPPCRVEMPELQRLHNSHQGRGLVVIGVSLDSPGDAHVVRQFLDEKGITFEIWSDPEAAAQSFFGFHGVPATYLLNKRGEIAWQHLGPITADDADLLDHLERALEEV